MAVFRKTTEASPSPDRSTIGRAIDAIVQKFGKGAIMALGGDPGDRPHYDVISTGSLNLDKALGLGGLPRGRIVEIYGPESSGKTTLMLHTIAEAQKLGLVCAFIDAEHALDVKYAAQLGVRLNDVLISQPDCGEQALEIVDTLARTGGVGLIVVDSVAALIPRAELEGDMGDQHLGLQARLMSQAMRKIAEPLPGTSKRPFSPWSPPLGGGQTGTTTGTAGGSGNSQELSGSRATGRTLGASTNHFPG